MEPGLGDLAVLCPACPQPGLNLPEDWEDDKEEYVQPIPNKCLLICYTRWVYTRSYTVDGNFTASHQRQKCPEDDVPLTNGHAFTTESMRYKEHLRIAKESKQEPCTCNEFKAERNVDIAGYDATGVGLVACLRHGFFQPEATVDFQGGEK